MVLSVFGGTVALSGAAAADIGANSGATIDNFGGSAQQTTNLSAAIRANDTYSGGNTFQKAKVDLNFGGFDGDFSSVTASDVRVRSYDSKTAFDNGNFNFSLTPTSISTSISLACTPSGPSVTKASHTNTFPPSFRAFRQWVRIFSAS
jgi:hypothetical protein